MSYFESALEIHKERFEPFCALIVLDDKMLRKYVMAWKPLLTKLVNEYPLDDDMAALWSCVTVDFQALADLTGDSMPDVMGYFRRCQGLQLIYPDGMVAEAVADVLRKALGEVGMPNGGKK